MRARQVLGPEVRLTLVLNWKAVALMLAKALTERNQVARGLTQARVQWRRLARRLMALMQVVLAQVLTEDALALVEAAVLTLALTAKGVLRQALAQRRQTLEEAEPMAERRLA